jgi:excisionase family DNA binding protein
MSKKETAFLLGVSLRSIDNFIARKELPCRRLGRRTLIPYSAIIAFSRRDHVPLGTLPKEETEGSRAS